MFNKSNLTLKKVLVIFLIITLTYANLILIGSHISEGLFSYALDDVDKSLVVANQELVMNQVCEINGEEKRVIQVAVQTGIESEEEPIKNTTITLGANIIESELEDVRVTRLNKNSYTNGTWEKTQEGKIIISLVNENKTLETKEEGLDKLLITYVFQNNEETKIKQPLEKVEVTTYMEEKYSNECVESYFENIEVEKELQTLKVVNKDIHKTKISEDGQVEFTENLNLDLSYRKNTSNIIIEDLANEFYNVDSQKNETVVLKYKTTTINKEDLLSLLGENGKLTITDTKTNKILAELTSEYITSNNVETEKIEQKFTIDETAEEAAEEVRAYLTITNEEVIIEYAVALTNFKLELTEVKPQSTSKVEFSDLVIKNTKNISNIGDKENLGYLQQNVKYLVDETEKMAETKVTFKDTITRANLTVDNTDWEIGQANTVKYTITLDTTSEKSELFVNPIFLLELPSSVESVNTANSQFRVNNDNGAFTEKQVFVTSVMGRKFIAITIKGQQTSETIQNGNTTIDLTLELNIAENTTEGDKTTKLYYQNDTVTAYESGKGFDTAEVTVDMIVENEEKDDIEEVIIDRIYTYITTNKEDVVRPSEEIEYKIYIENYDLNELQDLQLIDTLPQGVTLERVVEVSMDEEKQEYSIENDVQYKYNETTNELIVNIDNIKAMPLQFNENKETGEKIQVISPTKKLYKIVVKVNDLETGTYNREIKNSVIVKEGKNIYKTNEVVNNISKQCIVVETQKIENSVSEKERIIFEVRVTNKDLVDVSNKKFNANIPDDVELFMVEYGILGETSSESTVIGNEYEQTFIDIPGEKTYFIKLSGRVKELDETRQIVATGNFDGQEISWNAELLNKQETTEEIIAVRTSTNKKGGC